jgi:hypothetical protein
MATTLSETDITRLMWCSTSSTVEQEQLRIARQRAGELDAFARRERQSAGRTMGVRSEIHEGDELVRPLGDVALLDVALRQAEGIGDEPRGGAAVAAHLHVVEYGHAVEQRHVLKRAADAELGNDVPGLGKDRAPLEQDIAVVGNVEP